jgi:hypothetical protein
MAAFAAMTRRGFGASLNIGGLVKEVHRSKAALVVVRVPEGELLAAVGRAEGIVEIQDLVRAGRHLRAELIEPAMEAKHVVNAGRGRAELWLLRHMEGQPREAASPTRPPGLAPPAPVGLIADHQCGIRRGISYGRVHFHQLPP